jgi:hypothetical protein
MAQSSRNLVWINDSNFRGWGCSDCGWVFNPSGPPIGESLDEMKSNFNAQLAEAFASHACDRYPRRLTPHFPRGQN